MTTPVIDKYVANYLIHCQDRNEQPLDPDLLKVVLSDFLIEEQWLGQNEPDRLSVGLKSLRTLLADQPKALKLARLIQREVKALRAKLFRQECANVDLIDHANSLSDQLAKLQL